MQAISGHTTTHSNRVLFGNAHVKKPLWKFLSKLSQASARHHGSSNRHHFGIFPGDFDEFVAEDARVGLCLIIHWAESVIVRWPVFRLFISLSLLGFYVYNDVFGGIFRHFKRLYQLLHIVPIDNADIGKAHLLKEQSFDEHEFYKILHPLGKSG